MSDPKDAAGRGIPWIWGLGLLGVVVGLFVFFRSDPPRPGPEPTAARESAAPAPDVAAAEARTPEDPLPVPPEDAPSAWSDWFPADDPAWAWARVDLEDLRQELPDNAFWELAVPTDDARVLAEREATRERWNRELGKVMSNTASESEVRAFYGERNRISSDYVAFTDLALERYGDVLPPRDKGLLELARTLHLARLEELPRRLSEALERRERHAALRDQWLADEAAFAESRTLSKPELDSD
ncbi:MAG: hypothetical protein AAF430_15360 [Myxococcota bacterium]